MRWPELTFTGFFGDTRRRRIFYVVSLAILALLTIFPRPYVGQARLLPRDPSSALGAALGGGASRVQDLSILFSGGVRVIDLYLAIAQSADVRNEVVDKLKLAGPDQQYPTRDAALVAVEREVDVESLPGGILQVVARTHDAQKSLGLTRAFSDAIAERLRKMNSEQIGVKQALLEQRFEQSSARLARAQGALNEFRRANRISAAPEVELGNAIAVKSGIEARLRAKQVELGTLQEVLGPDNEQLRTVQAELSGLRQQLARATSPSDSAGGPNAGGLTELSTQYLERYRDYLFAQSIYDAYARASEQVAIEDLSGHNAPTVQYVEQPHLEPGIQFNTWAVAGLALLLLVIVFTDFYAPATGISLWFRKNIES